MYRSKYEIDFNGNEAVILKHFYDYKESLNPSGFQCDPDTDSTSIVDGKMLQAYASKNHSLAFMKLFNECCHNCGLLIRKNQLNKNRKLLSNAINGNPHVRQMRSNVPYTYIVGDKYVTCQECITKPDWRIDYVMAVSTSNKYDVPVELQHLNEYEANQIALCGGFYSLYKKQNVQSKIFEHRQGENNIGKKRDLDYHNMFTTFYNIDRPYQVDTSNEKIKASLRWLKNIIHCTMNFFLTMKPFTVT